MGYGILYAQNTWQFSDYGNRFGYKDTTKYTPIKPSITKTNRALGLVLSSYYKIGDVFNVGIIYRPTFLRFNTADRFKYEHLISLDLAWKTKLFNIPRKRMYLFK